MWQFFNSWCLLDLRLVVSNTIDHLLVESLPLILTMEEQHILQIKTIPFAWNVFKVGLDISYLVELRICDFLLRIQVTFTWFCLGYCSVEYKVCEDEDNAFSISQSGAKVSAVDAECTADFIVIEGLFAIIIMNLREHYFIYLPKQRLKK